MGKLRAISELLAYLLPSWLDVGGFSERRGGGEDHNQLDDTLPRDNYFTWSKSRQLSCLFVFV